VKGVCGAAPRSNLRSDFPHSPYLPLSPGAAAAGVPRDGGCAACAAGGGAGAAAGRAALRLHAACTHQLAAAGALGLVVVGGAVVVAIGAFEVLIWASTTGCLSQECACLQLQECACLQLWHANHCATASPPLNAHCRWSSTPSPPPLAACPPWWPACTATCWAAWALRPLSWLRCRSTTPWTQLWTPWAQL